MEGGIVRITGGMSLPLHFISLHTLSRSALCSAHVQIREKEFTRVQIGRCCVDAVLQRSVRYHSATMGECKGDAEIEACDRGGGIDAMIKGSWMISVTLVQMGVGRVAHIYMVYVQTRHYKPSSRYDSLTLQPSVIDITRVTVCFSTPINSTTSPSGSLMVGNVKMIRTIV